uniref:Uncharacterized protein n=1 Tax=Pristionchus pacificus TaxID=54126 RepID=A0A2A6CZU7_PRIPA|eukprot:PDM83553.1 hypothetical protein PRIPAC_30040 [Pristionchus pacificus]
MDIWDEVIVCGRKREKDGRRLSGLAAPLSKGKNRRGDGASRLKKVVGARGKWEEGSRGYVDGKEEKTGG